MALSGCSSSHPCPAAVQLSLPTCSHMYFTDNEKVLADYGTAFVMAWKNTHNYRVWNSNRHPALAEINPK